MENLHGSPIDDKIFNTFCDHFSFFRLPTIIREVKDEPKADAHKPFKIRDPRRKFRAAKLVEKTVASFALLHTRVDSWASD
jgi:hypothetical protein